MKKLRDFKKCFKIKKIYIEKNTKYGIIISQSVDTKSAHNAIPNSLWEMGHETGCNMTRRS